MTAFVQRFYTYIRIIKKWIENGGMILLLLILLGIMDLSCRNEDIYPGIVRYTVDESKFLRAVHFANPEFGFVSGGTHDQEGYIFRTINGGQTWDLVFSSTWSINDVRCLNDTIGLACGDSLHIVKTVDQGSSWFDLDLAWYPYDEHVVPLKHIEIADDTTWYFTGGRYYQYGINIRTQNGGSWLDNMVFQVELNTSWFRDARYGLLGGYGIIYSTPDANESFIPTPFQGDNITAFSFKGTEKGYACGFNGGIYETDDGGASWNTVLDPNGIFGNRIHFNSMDRGPTNAMAVGNGGVVYYSENGSSSWKALEVGSDDNFNDVFYLNGAYLILNEQGSILKINF